MSSRAESTSPNPGNGLINRFLGGGGRRLEAREAVASVGGGGPVVLHECAPWRGAHSIAESVTLDVKEGAAGSVEGGVHCSCTPFLVISEHSVSIVLLELQGVNTGGVSLVRGKLRRLGVSVTIRLFKVLQDRWPLVPEDHS